MIDATETMTREQRKSFAVEYFKRLDSGGDVFELFADDAELHFPKWGIARGTAEMQRMFGDVGQLFTQIRHPQQQFNVIVEGDTVVVEGTSHGVTADGTPWRDGRWCDVFEIRDFKVQRCFVYLDPDYAGADTERYPWLRAGMG
jgi:ketosteroid isomerase-like protein